jgi:hypothetical protein
LTQRSPYGDSSPGAGAVHHIKTGRVRRSKINAFVGTAPYGFGETRVVMLAFADLYPAFGFNAAMHVE